jgi:hypothetical protein
MYLFGCEEWATQGSLMNNPKGYLHDWTSTVHVPILAYVLRLVLRYTAAVICGWIGTTDPPWVAIDVRFWLTALSLPSQPHPTLETGNALYWTNHGPGMTLGPQVPGQYLQPYFSGKSIRTGLDPRAASLLPLPKSLSHRGCPWDEQGT